MFSLFALFFHISILFKFVLDWPYNGLYGGVMSRGDFMTFDFETLMQGFIEAQVEGGPDAGVAFLNGATTALNALLEKKDEEAVNENQPA